MAIYTLKAKCEVKGDLTSKVGITRIQHGLYKHFDLFIELATPQPHLNKCAF